MTTQLVPDSEYTGIMKLLPAKLRGFALLARFDRPIGWWLLFWPCVFGLALSGGLIARWDLALWMSIMISLIVIWMRRLPARQTARWPAG